MVLELSAFLLCRMLGIPLGSATLARWPSYTRLIGSVLRSLREREYMVATRSLGDRYIMLRQFPPYR